MPARAANPAQTLPWRSWYSLQRWRTRAKHQLRVSPLCALCEAKGRVVPAEVADHFPPHKGDYTAFLRGPLRSLCKPCHDGLSGFVHKGYSDAIDANGLPLDPRHPFNRTRGTASRGRQGLGHRQPYAVGPGRGGCIKNRSLEPDGAGPLFFLWSRFCDFEFRGGRKKRNAGGSRG